MKDVQLARRGYDIPKKSTSPSSKSHRRLPAYKRIEEFRTLLIPWFSKHGRSFVWRQASVTEYQIIIAEILLQRTQATTVDRFLPMFFDRYPSWEDIARSGEDEVAEVLKPIGLWRRRADTLTKLAQQIVTRHGVFPNRRAEIELLPGVGQYIANAIEMICFGIPRPLLDNNMSRVIERYFGPRKLADIRYDPYLQKLAARVVDTTEFLQVNWAILDLAALICIPKAPRCLKCPLSSKCRTVKTQHKKS